MVKEKVDQNNGVCNVKKQKQKHRKQIRILNLLYTGFLLTCWGKPPGGDQNVLTSFIHLAVNAMNSKNC